MKSACHNSSVKHYKNGYYCSVCFKEQFITPKKIRIVYALLLMTLLLCAFRLKAPTLTTGIAGYSFSLNRPGDIVPTDSTVLVELVKNKCVLTSVAVAQARIESGNYTSDIAVNNRNLFGIKVHQCPYVVGERKGHAVFESYKDNIACYCKIQQRYLNKIHRSYAEDSLYAQKIRRMK